MAERFATKATVMLRIFLRGRQIVAPTIFAPAARSGLQGASAPTIASLSEGGVIFFENDGGSFL